MSMLRKLFGPSQAEVWRQLSAETGAQFVEGGFWGRHKVVIKVKAWTLTLDTYTVNKHTYTRLRAPYVNPDGFHFTIYRTGIFTGLGKLLGTQDVEVGHPEFDRDFVIKGTDAEKLRRLFDHAPLRELIEAQPEIYLHVKDDEGWFGADFPEGVDELSFQIVGVIKDVERLKDLFKLFAVTLNYLCHIGSAYENDPKIKVK